MVFSQLNHGGNVIITLRLNKFLKTFDKISSDQILCKHFIQTSVVKQVFEDIW